MAALKDHRLSALAISTSIDNPRWKFPESFFRVFVFTPRPKSEDPRPTDRRPKTSAFSLQHHTSSTDDRNIVPRSPLHLSTVVNSFVAAIDKSAEMLILDEMNDEGPLLLSSVVPSLDELREILSHIDLRPSSSSEPQRLPAELLQRILSFLVIERVYPIEVKAINCSSHDKVHSLNRCLVDEHWSWWLSAPGTMKGGRGQQYVQFLLGPRLRRLSSICIKIPPLPQGPLSVREFLVQQFTLERGWHAVSPIFTVQDHGGWQRFVLPGKVDVDEVRVVCLSNQISAAKELLSQQQSFGQNGEPLDPLRRFQSVGFFTIRFE